MKKKILLSASLIATAITPIAFVAASCQKELTQEQVENQTKIEANSKAIELENFTEKDIKYTVPKDHKVTKIDIEKIKLENKAVVTLTIENSKKKVYKVIYVINDFKKIELTQDQIFEEWAKNYLKNIKFEATNSADVEELKKANGSGLTYSYKSGHIVWKPKGEKSWDKVIFKLTEFPGRDKYQIVNAKNPTYQNKKGQTALSSFVDYKLDESKTKIQLTFKVAKFDPKGHKISAKEFTSDWIEIK
ncbi:hypothetical protein JPM7_5650 [Metamycoplasma equirhinis]|uniref:variable surface lipoprotein n=1 Tax=Metamycoplasma equirhinis TaxID=92402 RepID=UPI002573D4A5|nr:variable surface lipoprotein [Metamycoplasma equirhinis]BDX52958.1 hypothetical protein JPM7_5650 [Metamycoplasma equirhinis]